MIVVGVDGLGVSTAGAEVTERLCAHHIMSESC